MTTGVMVVGNIRSKNPAERFRAQDDHVIQAFSANGTYQAFDVRRLPRRSRGDEDFGAVQVGNLLAEGVAIDPVTVAHKVAGSRIPRECLHELCCRPLGRRMSGHIEMHDTPAVMSQNQKDKQKLEINGRYNEEVD